MSLCCPGAQEAHPTSYTNSPTQSFTELVEQAHLLPTMTTGHPIAPSTQKSHQLRLTP